VDNAHAVARGISQVVFSGLESRETDEDDVMLVTLFFVEHVPPVQTAEKRVTGSDEAVIPEDSTVSAEPDDKIMVDVA
jgi:hypothetical protein